MYSTCEHCALSAGHSSLSLSAAQGCPPRPPPQGRAESSRERSQVSDTTRRDSASPPPLPTHSIPSHFAFSDATFSFAAERLHVRSLLLFTGFAAMNACVTSRRVSSRLNTETRYDTPLDSIHSTCLSGPPPASLPHCRRRLRGFCFPLSGQTLSLSSLSPLAVLSLRPPVCSARTFARLEY